MQEGESAPCRSARRGDLCRVQEREKSLSKKMVTTPQHFQGPKQAGASSSDTSVPSDERAQERGGAPPSQQRWWRVRLRMLTTLVADDLAGLGVQDQRDDQAVQTQHLGENENQNHADEQPRLLRWEKRRPGARVRTPCRGKRR